MTNRNRAVVEILAQDKVTAILKQIEKNTRKTSTQVIEGNKKIESSNNSLFLSFKNIAILLGTGFVAKFVKESLSEFAKFEAAKTAFERIRGESALFLKSVEEATRGTVSQLDILTNANLFFLNIAGATNEQFLKLAEAAVVLGQATCVDAAGAFERLIKGIAKAEPELLDEIGLTNKLGDALKKYADDSGISVNAIDQQTKKMIFLNEVLKSSEEVLTNLGSTQNNTATTFARLSKSISDLKIEVGEELAPAFKELMDIIIENKDELVTILTALTKIAAAMGQIVGKGIQFSELMGIGWGAMQAKEAAGFLPDKKERLTGIETMKQLEQKKVLDSSAKQILNESDKIFEELAANNKKFTKEQKQYIEFVLDAKESLSSNILTLDEYVKYVDYANQMLSMNSAVSGLASESLDKFNKKMQDTISSAGTPAGAAESAINQRFKEIRDLVTVRTPAGDTTTVLGSREILRVNNAQLAALRSIDKKTRENIRNVLTTVS